MTLSSVCPIGKFISKGPIEEVDSFYLLFYTTGRRVRGRLQRGIKMIDNETNNQRTVLKNIRIWKASLIKKGIQAFFVFMPGLVGIVCTLAVWCLCHKPQVENILENEINTINTMIGVMGLILSGFAVYYGRKAYCVAQDIFEKGIQINKKKVLDEVGWEFVSDFFIPLSDLYEVVTEYFPKKNGKYCPKDNTVEAVYNEFKRIKLPDRFDYWELHKRDAFDALDINEGHENRKTGEQHQDKAFFDICEFVGKALELQNRINVVVDKLKKISTTERDGGSKKVRLDELFDTMDENGRISKELDELFNQMETLLKYENKLPKELNIKKTILLMKNRNGSNEVIQ